MIDAKQLEDSRRRCLKAVATVRDVNTVERVIPIAFPVYTSTWNIRLRVEKTTGLVDRHVLTAVKMFGPVTSGEIAELMGLDADVIESSLCELARHGVALERQGTAWHMPEDAEIQHFYVEQTHDFGFVSNGLTGDFLPLSQTEPLDSVTIVGEECSKLRLVAMKHMRSSCEGAMMGQIASTDRAHRFLGYGIPDGFLSFASPKPVCESSRFVLAFLFVFKDGQVEVVSAAESAFRLDCPKQIADGYLKGRKTREKAEVEVYDGIDCRDKGNVRLLTVRNERLWTADARPGEASEASVRLLRRMTYPGWTCDLDGGFHLLSPGDDKTARRLAVMRGCSLLRRSYAQIDDERDLAWIAEVYSDECARDFPSLKKLPDFSEVIAEAAESSDDNVAELARRFGPKVHAVKSTGTGTVRFMRSQGASFQETVVDAIDSAKSSVMIVSPVLGDDGVFQALERARTRGVRDIRVVTQLSEHRNNMFNTDPQFADNELPRRRLASLGVGVRDCSHTVHAKFLIVDSSWMFVTTANLNANSLGVGKVKAVEAALEFRDTLAARAGEALFLEIWNSACYRQVRTDDRISIVSNPRTRGIRTDFSVQSARGYAFMISTYGNQLLARKLSIMVASATRSVDILSMSFYDLCEIPGLFAEMGRALSRGVKIRVCVRPGAEMNFKPDQWPDPSTRELCRAGLELRQYDHLHAKGILVDEDQVLMTSANFNQFSLGCSATAHIEMAVFGTTNLKPLKDFADFMKKVLDGSMVAR